ncbi:MAG: hypothetical protein ACOY90_21870 [Candidatus Zhuqueibacterota bacterium]
MTKKIILLSFVAFALMVGGCSKESPVAPDQMETAAGNSLAKQTVTADQSQSRLSSRWENVSFQGTVLLGIHTIDFGDLDALWNALDNADAFDVPSRFSPNYYFSVDAGAKSISGFGAVPGDDIVIAGVSGKLCSILTYELNPAEGKPGPMRARLIHLFEGKDGSFVTMDRAALVPVGTDPNVSMVNDYLEIMAGTGVFENASGRLTNQGIIDLNTFTLTVNLIGRVSGDGI